ncbi:hypothetical protein [Hahella chejuensis]|uniref:hypothetical protein n=1 Tax=Hahella chejuensis TaxID=158327 RepID=UPI00030DEB32|nr:hypothetical protein [Hahella chejuensis]
MSFDSQARFGIAPFAPQKPLRQGGQQGEFIIFSKETQGKSGRKVFINTGLIPVFMTLINPDTFDGTAITKQIVALKGIAGGLQSCSNLKSAFEHMILIKHVQIFYKIIQDGPVKAGVYITNIRPAYSRDTNQAGLYNVNPLSGSSHASITHCPNSYIDSKYNFAAINGASEGIEEAANNIYKTNIPKTDYGDKQGFSLFYNPTHFVNDLGVWITPALKTHDPESAAKKLVEVFIDTSKHRRIMGKSKKLSWLIFGNGVKLLEMALNSIPAGLSERKDLLEQHKFQIVDPSTDPGLVLRRLNKLGAQFDDQPVLATSKMSRASAINMAISRNNISGEIKELSKSQNKDYSGAALSFLNGTHDASKTFSKAHNSMHLPRHYTFEEIVKQAKGMYKW